MSEIVAFIAGAMAVLSSTPQIVKIIRTGDAMAVSYGTYFMLVSAGFLWVLYALIEGSMAILFWNSIGVFLALTVIFIKYFSSKKATHNET